MKLKQYKIARRLGAKIFAKTQNPKFILHKKVRRKKRPSPVSEYGLQLIEKQKMRYTYNLSEKQFARYVKMAIAKKGTNPVEYLYTRLESRLDNIVFRLGLVGTRPFARQVVSHGHITVNGRRVTIPSYSVVHGDEIGVREQSKDKKAFTAIEETTKEYVTPPWLSFNVKKRSGKVVGAPKFDDTSEDVFNVTSVIEFYSR